MISATVEIKGISQLQRKLYRLERKVGRKILSKGCRAACKLITEATKSYAPSRTGALARSLKTRAGKRSRKNKGPVFKTSTTPQTFYGRFVDQGTIHIEARNFMRRGFDKAQKQAGKTALDIYWEEIKRIAS